jgi:hypothetical protein
VKITRLAGGTVQFVAAGPPTVWTKGAAEGPSKTHAVAEAAAGNRSERLTRIPVEALVFTRRRFGRWVAVGPPSTASIPRTELVTFSGTA